ncbi:MAG TPA: hypothetical protein VFS05_03770 [Gemmatimonadaceae bacterium]|nr:hypothetical protein [Gemmatimonadaceae bacterium]
MRALVSIVVALTTTGCYTYTPVAAPTPAPGTSVQAQLTDQGTRSLGNLLGFGVVEVRGDVANASPDSLTISVQAVRLGNGVENFWQGERVTLDRSLISRVSERTFSLKKTLLTGAGFVAVAIAAGSALGGSSGGGGPAPGGGTGQK